MNSSLSILRWWQNLPVHSPAMVYDPSSKAEDKAYGSLVEGFLDRWKRHSKQVFDALSPEYAAIRATGSKLGQVLLPWWDSTRSRLWPDFCGQFGKLASILEQMPSESFSQMKREIMGAKTFVDLAGFSQIREIFDKAEHALKLARTLNSFFDPAKKDSPAASLIDSWWKRCSRSLEEFTSEPMGRALLSAIGFGDPNLVTCDELSPHPDSYRANAADDSQMRWFVFPEQPPNRRSIINCLPRKEVSLAIPGQLSEFANAVEQASRDIAKNIWMSRAAELNALHQMQARSPWAACKALDLLLQPASLSDIALSQEWFWQVGVTFDDWMKGKLGVKPPDGLRMAYTFIMCVYSIVDRKICPNWVARVSTGQTLTSERAEPIASLISFVMHRLAQWDADQGTETQAATAAQLPSISLEIRPAERRRSYWLIINSRENDRIRIAEAAVDLLGLFNIGEEGKNVPYETVQQLRSASGLLNKHIRIGKKVGNRITTVAAPSLVNRISIQRHPERPRSANTKGNSIS